jgi:type II secretory pathway pseudopilin PulG
MKRAFTIVELLGVMVVLATLFGLILPAMKLSIRTAQKKQAAADTTALAQAVIHYRQTYGFWPGTEGMGDTNATSESRTFYYEALRPAWADANVPFAASPGFSLVTNDLVGVIRALVPSPADTAVADPDPNPRRIRFLDIPASRLSHEGLFLDPWRTPYAIVIHPPGTIAGRPVGWSDVVAFSFGPPGRIASAATNLIFSAGVPR